MYQELKDVFQYLVSVRKLKSYLSIDIEFPIHLLEKIKLSKIKKFMTTKDFFHLYLNLMNLN
jgi:hypothetical protein